jgi:BASS family bile acid:Na+ symporter
VKIALVVLSVSPTPPVLPKKALKAGGTVLSLAAFVLAGLIIGHALGGPEPDNRPVLALATALRHPAVALAIAHANLPAQRLAAAEVFLYLILSGILSALYLSWVTRQRRERTSGE